MDNSKHFAMAIICGAKRGPKDDHLTFSPASLRDFLEAIAEHPTPVQDIEYCTDYHCAGDCGQPHNQKEMQDFLKAQPAPMSQPNRVIAYSAASKLRKLGYEWADDAWRQPAPVQDEDLYDLAVKADNGGQP